MAARPVIDKNRYSVVSGVIGAGIGSLITFIIYIIIFAFTTMRYDLITWFIIPVAVSSFFSAFFTSRHLIESVRSSNP